MKMNGTKEFFNLQGFARNQPFSSFIYDWMYCISAVKEHRTWSTKVGGFGAHDCYVTSHVQHRIRAYPHLCERMGTLTNLIDN